MKFFDYFTQGLQNTLKFKNRGGFSFRNEAIPVYNNTVIDTWFMGDFTSATYEIAVEYGVNDVERLTVIVGSRVGQASLTVYGRTNTGKDLVQFSTTVNNSNVSLIASPLYAADGVTALKGVYLTWTATYAERMVRLQAPTLSGESNNLGGELGVLSNWTSNLGSQFLQVNDAGSIDISNINSIVVPGQPTLTSKFILETLTLGNTDGFIKFTLDPLTNTVALTVTGVSALTVTNSISSTITSGTLDNVLIGSTNPSSITAFTLSVTQTSTLSPANGTVTMSPTGSGRVVFNPTVTGAINNVSFGGFSPAAARFKILKLSQAPTLGTQLVSLGSIQARLILGAI